MTKAIVIHVDESVSAIDIDPTLERLQKLVGGYIEYVPVAPSGFKVDVAIVNEEGIPQDLPANPVASYLLNRPLRGDVVVIGQNPDYDDDEDCGSSRQMALEGDFKNVSSFWLTLAD